MSDFATPAKHVLPLIEGIFSYGGEPSPFEENDRRIPGWNLGRQIVCQYGIEVALKMELVKYQESVHRHHDFEKLFRMIPKERRDKAEKTYRAVLWNRVSWTWDVFKTLESSFHFMGKNPTAETRYLWQKWPDGPSNTLGVRNFQSLVTAENYFNIMMALMFAFHEYPVWEGSLTKRHKTEFRSLKDSLPNLSGARWARSPDGEGRS